MSTDNMIQQVVVPQKPKVIAEERIFVYIPTASKNSKGIASYKEQDFNITNSEVSLKWPIKMLVEDLADPISKPSLTKVLPDEFVKTEKIVTLTNPYTLESYNSHSAEIKLNRDRRDPLIRPDLIMIDTNDFNRSIEINSTGETYYKYKLKVNDPFEQPSLVKLSSIDFKSNDEVIIVDWSKLKLGINSKLKFDDSGGLIVTGFKDIENRISAIRTNIDSLKSFLGIYNNIEDVNRLHPPEEILLGSTVFITSTNSYWMVSYDNNIWAWYNTTIDYIQDISHVETTQYIHNWRDSPKEFIKTIDSNEAYWAGSKEDFGELDIDDLPLNSLIIVEDNENILPEFYITERQLELAGLDITSNDLIVSIDNVTNINNKPITIVTNGLTRKVEPLTYLPNKIIVSDDSGVLEASTIDILDLTEIMSDLSVISFDKLVTINNEQLIPNRLLVSNLNNTITNWEGSVYSDAMIVTGDTLGTIKVKQHNNTNRLFVTGENGTLVELSAGETGQILMSGGKVNLPGWIDLPTMNKATLQAVRFTNPTALEANEYEGGLIAVILDSEPNELRNNCIYYIG